MRSAGKGFSTVLLAILFIAGGAIFVFGASTAAQRINLPEAGSYNVTDDDDTPEVRARVARISFIRGEVSIRRADQDDWEKATLNLPVVEGDEITTDANGRVEIQFDKNEHLRLAGNSFLKIVNLKDEGIAVSLSLGTLNLRITSFNKDKSFFEIDAPKTTLAVQRAGSYRIDAGKEGDSEIRVAAMNGGEARVYSENAGFTVKDGRSARIFIDGSNAGEWEATDATRSIDDFDTWALDRDSIIANRLKDAYYDRFYDDDIYGADDLNGNGEWVYTRNYGYVWRPFPGSISGYADWSPYRYGHWRWMPPYGWIWVNDEPWGWATYHHGRWFYDDGYWSWSPYGYYRPSRSWWEPALVVISIVSENICWYPLPYHHHHYNYNWGFNRDHHPRRGDNDRGRETVGIVGRVKGLKPDPGKPDPTDLSRRQPVGEIEVARGNEVPLAGVVSVNSNEFGTRASGARRAPAGIAKSLLDRRTEEGNLPTLPAYAEQKRRVRPDIVTDKPAADAVALKTKVGAGVRKADVPLDNELRTTRVFGGRPPQKSDNGTVKAVNGGSFEPRRTGAVDRAPVDKTVNPDPAVVLKDSPPNVPRKPREDSPRFEPPTERETPPSDQPKSGKGSRLLGPPIRETPPADPPKERKDSPRLEPPIDQEKPRNDPPKPKESPRFEPPIDQEKPRNDPPKPKESPRFEPPVEREQPRNETPKPRETPRSDPPKSEPAKPKESPKSDPPKSEPKQENKPPAKPDGPVRERMKDG